MENQKATSQQPVPQIDDLLRRIEKSDYDPTALKREECKFLENCRIEIIKKSELGDSKLQEAPKACAISITFRDNFSIMEQMYEEAWHTIGKILQAGNIAEVRTHSHELKSKAINFIASLISQCELQDHFQIKSN